MKWHKITYVNIYLRAYLDLHICTYHSLSYLYFTKLTKEHNLPRLSLRLDLNIKQLPVLNLTLRPVIILNRDNPYKRLLFNVFYDHNCDKIIISDVDTSAVSNQPTLSTNIINQYYMPKRSNSTISQLHQPTPSANTINQHYPPILSTSTTSQDPLVKEIAGKNGSERESPLRASRMDKPIIRTHGAKPSNHWTDHILADNTNMVVCSSRKRRVHPEVMKLR